ncbi:MAG: metal-dependent hydrolase [Isosphaeraceae bacterium]|nr:metal-dependent hydrolase [Isosphaeraceae bacterium]
MGNYRQHLGFAGVLGVGYAVGTFLLTGIHWLYGSVAALLATISGLLPDLDSDSGVEMKGFTGMLGVLVAVAVWEGLGKVHPPPAFELHLWATVSSYVAVRHGIRRVASRLTVHRGISHSIPTCAVWGSLVYLYYPTGTHSLRLVMAVAVMLGFLSHLLLDEICSVDLSGARVNKAFGTAIKFWAPSPWSTVAVYLLLSYLTWRILELWPEGDLWTLGPPPPEPSLPFHLPAKIGALHVPASLRR